MGQQAQYERYTARLLYVIASGNKISPNATDKFDKQIENLYRNPFTEKKKEQTSNMTAQQIFDRTLNLLEQQE